MKIKEFLIKISNNEIKQGTKFKIDGCVYIYNNGYIAKDDSNKTIEKFYISQRLLNDEVEIIEDKPKNIEEIDLYEELQGILKDNTQSVILHLIHKCLTANKCKINELSKAVNYLLDKEGK